MEALESDTSDGIIRLYPKDYKDLVQQNPRPYDVVLIWNVPAANNCEHCIQVESEFGSTAYSFMQHRTRKDSGINRPIFFCKIQFGNEAGM